MSFSLKFKLALLDNVIWLMLFCFFALCAAGVPEFASTTNIVNIFYHSSIMSLLVLAEGFVLISGKLDLSIDGILAFAPGVVVLAAAKGFSVLGNPWLCLALTVILGGLLGFFNGFCVAKLEMNPFMHTLSMSIILRGLVLYLIPLSIFPLNPVYSYIGKARFSLGNHSVPVAIAVVLLIYSLFSFILRRTVFGRNYMATGGNERASYVAGINTTGMILCGFVIAGMLAALAGILTAGRQDSVSNTMGSGSVMLAFAGALLGGTSMNGGKGSAFGMLGGSLLLGMFSNSLNLLGVTVTLVHAAQGTLILLAILVDRLRTRLRARLLRNEQLKKLKESEAIGR
ncbi:MAG: ABC transporter permease [Synergistaceae bacterium]|jgi:simple sugar transport system permease protein/ribose transport system permease protein|nr:ABC transporter permease [Synergistaceae bacterium]